ncbi:MAG: tetratricopeptide repeat protein [Myxococcales bacterium]|nr:tetratricopeptide repeat protein [Myxococcales bacterium]
MKNILKRSTLGLLTLGGFALYVGTGAAQPATPKTDAGASASDGGAASASDSGAAALAVEAGTPLATGNPDQIQGMQTAPTQAPSLRKSAPPPPPPTPQQLAALEQMRSQMDVYEKGAKDYRDAVTSIIRLHYETKKKEILAGLDGEIVLEKAELRKARETAIKRLQEFIERYQGPRAQPEATPDAMYRLAALYEERARSEDATEPLEVGLKDAIGLYKRIINEFPKYRELAGVYYFLGHAYVDSGRTDEGQQVWRSLVCHNKYPYPTPPDPKRPDRDTVNPLPQDHDETYWAAWRNTNRDPKALKRGGADTKYTEVFPASCEYLAQPNVLPGDDPKYVAEIWWQIGNWEFDQLDQGSGYVRDEPASVYGFNRAASAYTRAMRYRKPPLFGVSLYKYAWTLFKQQRYEAATKEFVKLLNYTDEQQKLTGDTGADFRGEAYTYIAGSLTNVDFAGPEADDPYIQRPDIIDTEPRPEIAEKKLHVAVDRVKDANLIPQDKPWTIEIYRALAGEFRSLNQFNNAIEVYQAMLQKWPMDPTAPDVQNALAETYDQLALSKKQGTPEHEAASQKALEARTALANYVGNKPWVDANKDNPAAIQNAERLVRGGLRQAAAQHTNNGKAALVAAQETGDAGRQLDLLTRAHGEYKLAAIGWDGYLKQDENAPDAYESRYWLADARRQQVRIQVVLHKIQKDKFPEPSRKEIDDALAAAIDVRDSNEDDKFLDNAAFFVVDIADVDRDIAYQRFEDSKGTQGVERRVEVKFDGPDPSTRKVVADPVPPVVQQSIQGRDDYVARVPANLDTQKHAADYQFYAGETYFLYGQFELARARFEPMYKEHCGKDEFGYRAWEKLITMSNLTRDAKRSTELAEAEKAKSCAVNDAQKTTAGLIVNPTLQEAAFVRARLKFEEAQKAPPGPGKDKLWREAAGMYEAALIAAPARDEAPEAAMNAAYAYKQVGDFSKAIDLYNKFISEYGSEDRLEKLQKGDAKAKVGPDPKKYAERLKYLDDAYDALGTTYYSFFNYQRAAETYEKVANNERFAPEKRKVAAKNAMILYASMGQRDKMSAMHKAFMKLSPTPEEKANADYLLADYDRKQWNPQGADSGSNRQFRIDAETNLSRYYQTYRSSAPALKYVVEAAHSISTMMRAANEPGRERWQKSIISAWEDFRVKGGNGKDGKPEALSSPFVDYVAETEFELIDAQIKKEYDVEAKHKYQGAVADVVGDGKGKKGRYQANAADADKWDQALDKLVQKYPSAEWLPAMVARQGSLFDTLRTGLFNLVPPQLKYFTPQQEAQIKMLENSGRPELEDKAAELRDTVKEGWRTKKEKELNGSDEVMVRRYATAVALARKFNVRNAAIQRAVARLAFFTEIIGEAKMRQYVTNTTDPTDKTKKLSYTDGQYVQTRSGQTAVPPPSGATSPLPAAP